MLELDIRKVVDYKAPGSKVLVRMLAPEEAAGSRLATTGKSNQGRIVDIGPSIEEKWGFAKGQRVLLQGTYVPVPKFPGDADERELGIVDPHMIQCILVEEAHASCSKKEKCCKNNS